MKRFSISLICALLISVSAFSETATVTDLRNASPTLRNFFAPTMGKEPKQLTLRAIGNSGTANGAAATGPGVQSPGWRLNGPVWIKGTKDTYEIQLRGDNSVTQSITEVFSNGVLRVQRDLRYKDFDGSGHEDSAVIKLQLAGAAKTFRMRISSTRYDGTKFEAEEVITLPEFPAPKALLRTEAASQTGNSALFKAAVNDPAGLVPEGYYGKWVYSTTNPEGVESYDPNKKDPLPAGVAAAWGIHANNVVETQVWQGPSVGVHRLWLYVPEYAVWVPASLVQEFVVAQTPHKTPPATPPISFSKTPWGTNIVSVNYELKDPLAFVYVEAWGIRNCSRPAQFHNTPCGGRIDVLWDSGMLTQDDKKISFPLWDYFWQGFDYYASAFIDIPPVREGDQWKTVHFKVGPIPGTFFCNFCQGMVASPNK